MCKIGDVAFRMFLKFLGVEAAAVLSFKLILTSDLRKVGEFG